MNHVPHNHVAIIGTGFGAIATAVRLQQGGRLGGAIGNAYRLMEFRVFAL